MSDAIDMELPLEPTTARRFRERLEPFRDALDQMSFIDLRLLVSELVVEALNTDPEAQDARIELCAELRDDRVHVEVAEDGPVYRLSARHPEPGEAGWGLHLMQRLSAHWGLRRGRETSTVWFEMPRPAVH
jgi:anti-sigma regulatory factor (Ser/Thr protein kinase)